MKIFLATLLFIITNPTLEYYDKNALYYEDCCYNINVEKLYQRFLPYLYPGSTILDAGCGPARDSRYFLDNGYQVIAFDGSKSMVELAKKNTGIDVLHLDFLNFTLAKSYDAIWACISLLHVPKAQILKVIQALCSNLRLNGIFYFSFKLGSKELIRAKRFYSDYNPDSIQELIDQYPRLKIIDQWITDDLKDPTLPKIIHTIAKKQC